VNVPVLLVRHHGLTRDDVLHRRTAGQLCSRHGSVPDLARGHSLVAELRLGDGLGLQLLGADGLLRQRERRVATPPSARNTATVAMTFAYVRLDFSFVT
jgi:hypothetical protein